MRRFLADRVSVGALLVLLCITAISSAAPLIGQAMGSDPERFVRSPSGRIAALQPPDGDHLLGTDEVGRDVLIRLLHAGRVSLLVGFGVALVALAIGGPLGVTAAYYGRWVDDLVNALVQVTLNVPVLFVLIVLSTFFSPGPLQLALLFGLFYWPRAARQVRAAVLSVQARDYVTAARMLGAGDAHIMRRHVLPNSASVLLVVAGIDVATAILAESSLSFLGFGVPAPLASWGNMLSLSPDLFRSAPWLVYPPGALIVITVLSVFLVSDGVRDALDPRTPLTRAAPTRRSSR
ncbi:MAG: ABC transporter permease [Chloroflexota bacterium]|nr:ABC transporter permease [Chloroflexota bacterium]